MVYTGLLKKINQDVQNSNFLHARMEVLGSDVGGFFIFLQDLAFETNIRFLTLYSDIFRNCSLCPLIFENTQFNCIFALYFRTYYEVKNIL